jgi:NTE family protein
LSTATRRRRFSEEAYSIAAASLDAYCSDTRISLMSLNRDPVLVDLAIQGGGSHDAFTWGVLDRILEEPWLRINGISGTSAGAMHTAVLASGYAKGGPKEARKALDDFRRRVSDAALLSPLKRTPLDMLLGHWTMDTSPVFIAMDMAARLFSPYDLNPAGINPLRDILAASVDPDELKKSSIKLSVTATNVRTGRGRVSRNADLTPDVLLASACLPTLFQAIEIDGEPYRDGGYSGNPTMTPLVRECTSQDTLIVAINPVERPGTPRSAQDIMNRLNEISFNATLLKELRMIALLRQAADPGHEEGAKWAGMRVHLISSPIMTSLCYSSKLNAEWAFLIMLKEEGRRTAEKFLKTSGNDIGQRSTLNLNVLLEQV